MSEQEEKKSLELNLPRISGNPLNLTISPGEQLFIVGANGSGKSSLIQHINRNNPGNYIEWIPSHRRLWFHSDSVDITASSRLEFAKSSFHQELEDQARWTDVYAQQRQSAILFDLVDVENRRARDIARLVDRGDIATARATSVANQSPFEKINDLLELGTLAVSLHLSDRETILALRKKEGVHFGISQMSDGERSAVSLAAKVLTVVPGTTLLIDEPERHLHPSISEPFLSALFECRSDCAFVVSTNDINLPVAHAQARVLLVHSCRWNGTKTVGWDTDLLETKIAIPEESKRAILGSRKRILFVEGDSAGSLDFKIYSALFSDVLIEPRGSFSEVQKAVEGVRVSKGYHRIEAYGLIDRDNRAYEDAKRLSGKFVFTLNVYSVEALYYCTDAIAAVSRQLAKSLGREPDGIYAMAEEAALAALRQQGVAERMSARYCERLVRKNFVEDLPTWKEIKGREKVEFQSSVSTGYVAELDRFNQFLTNKDLDQLVARYPIRESGAFGAVVQALELKSNHIYREMVIAQIRSDETLAQRLRNLVGPLSDTLGMRID